MKNDLTIDRKKTILFTGWIDDSQENLEDFFRKLEPLFTQLLSCGYNTVLFHSSSRLSTLAAGHIRGIKPTEEAVFCMCVLNKKSDREGFSGPTHPFDLITVLEEENRERTLMAFYDYLLYCSGLLVSYNPSNNPETNLIESVATRKKIRVLRMHQSFTSGSDQGGKSL